MPEVCAAIQRHVSRLEKRADRNLVKFNEGKMPSSAPVHAGANWLESSFAEKDLGSGGQVKHEAAVCSHGREDPTASWAALGKASP